MLEPKLFADITSVRAYRERLAVLQGVWDNLALLSQMNGDGTNMQATRAAFEQLAGNLLQNLTAESVRKTVLSMQGKAQVAIDVLVRNLYERTADIGFLCADQEVQEYLHCKSLIADEGAAETLNKLHKRLQRRFAEYVAKYSVYDNIVLLAPDGAVLVQLNGEPAVARSGDPLVKECLNTAAAYVESFRHIDLFPQQTHSLVYSFRVSVANKVLGILCLSFRLTNEAEGIFAKLLEPQDWNVLTYVDANGHVIASSDPWQIPIGAPLEQAGVEGKTLRFAGREYLAVSRSAKAYQGYRGPGWRCQALIPLEQVGKSDTALGTALPPTAFAAVRKSTSVFSRELQQVPAQAEAIQRQLNRAVWNGHIRIGHSGDANNAFSKVLLREISHTGRKTQEVFEHSIAELERTVVSTILQDSRTMAALATDILDRNLYERANDCRWWALDRRLCRYLSAPDGNIGDITQTLQHINQLYTVYHTLVLFDAQARVVAVSNPEGESLIGTSIDATWAQATLSLRDSQNYHVSVFEPNPFYQNRSTLTYGAALRAEGRVVGGIGIVFDAAPQLHAMLSDALMRKDGSIAVFADKEGQVLSATERYRPGERLPFERALLSPPKEGHTHIVVIDDTYYAVGVQATAGYREYAGLSVLAVVMIPLGAVSDCAAASPTHAKASTYRSQPGERSLELATFCAGGHWLAVPLSQVIEAVDTSGLHALPEKRAGQAGYLMHDDKALLVADLATLLGNNFGNNLGNKQTTAHREIVLVRTGEGKKLGLLVEILGDIPQVNLSEIIPSIDMFASRSLTDSMVRSQTAEDPLLLILNPERVAAALNQPRPDSQAEELSKQLKAGNG